MAPCTFISIVSNLEHCWTQGCPVCHFPLVENILALKPLFISLQGFLSCFPIVVYLIWTLISRLHEGGTAVGKWPSCTLTTIFHGSDRCALHKSSPRALVLRLLLVSDVFFFFPCSSLLYSSLCWQGVIGQWETILVFSLYDWFLGMSSTILGKVPADQHEDEISWNIAGCMNWWFYSLL